MAQASTSQVCTSSTLSMNEPRFLNTTSNSITGMSSRCRRGHMWVGTTSTGTLCLCIFSGTQVKAHEAKLLAAMVRHQRHLKTVLPCIHIQEMPLTVQIRQDTQMPQVQLT